MENIEPTNRMAAINEFMEGVHFGFLPKPSDRETFTKAAKDHFGTKQYWAIMPPDWTAKNFVFRGVAFGENGQPILEFTQILS